MISPNELSRVEPKSLASVFLETAEEDSDELAPLTPFLIHTAKLAQSASPRLHIAEERAKFIYWFLDTRCREIAPYRWPVPPKLLAWLNAPAKPISFAGTCAGSRTGLSLTRFMWHIWSQHKRELPFRPGDATLRFLTWFAFEYMPASNIPPALLPNDLLGVLNHPIYGESWPVTLGMAVRAQTLYPERFKSIEPEDEPVRLAMSFEALTDVLRIGDPRLLPAFVTRFWSASPAQAPDLTRYEYVAARAWHPELAASGGWKPPDCVSARTWFQTQFTLRFPNTDVFGKLGNASARASASIESLRTHAKAIVVYRDFETRSGLSRAGKIAADALRRASLPVVELHYRLSRSGTEHEFRDNGRQFCDAESAIHLVNVNPELFPECLACNLPRISESDYIIGQFYWELSDISSWHECALSLVDEIWVASEYLKEIYAKRTRIPVVVMGQAVEAAPALAHADKSSLGLPSDSYLFFFSFHAGSMVERKNPLAVVTAFLEAFPRGSENVSLLIKTMATAGLRTANDRAHWTAVCRAAAKDPRITILDREVSDSDMASLHEAADCYVSLHRSEGFGFGPADAMVRGKPVIVTAYSGVTDFCNPETALLVDFQLRQVEMGSYPYMDNDRSYYWADPNVETASKHMRELYEAPEKGSEMGARARKLVSERYSVAALADRYRKRLAELGAL